MGAASASLMALYAVVLVQALGAAPYLDHVGGAQLALADWLAAEGTLYPPWFDGQHTGGTRFFPLPIVILGAAGAITGSVVIPAQLLSAASMVAIAALVYRQARVSGGDRALALGAAALMGCTPVALHGSFAGRFDPLATFLALASVAVIGRVPASRTHVTTSAVVAALAVLTRVTTLWAPVAVLAALMLRHGAWRRWTATFAAGVALGVIATWLASGGRFEDTLRLVFVEAPGGSQLAAAPLWLFERLSEAAPASLLLAPISLLGALSPGAGWAWRVALAMATVVTLYVVRGGGIGTNHLLDLIALVTLCFARCAGGAEPRTPLAATVRLVTLAILAVTCIHLSKAAVGGVDAIGQRPLVTTSALAKLAPEGDRVLADDPLLAVAAGRRPVVLDAFMLMRLPGDTGDRARAFVEEAVRRRRFDRIVLMYDVDHEFYQHTHFGPRFVQALTSSYALSERRLGYWIYQPAPLR